MSLFWWRKRQELKEELDSHLRMSAQDRISRGEDASDATRSARRELGNATLIRETTRDQWAWRWLETLLQDIRYGLRGFRRTPMFALTVVATIALALGINTALFTTFDAYVLRPVPVRDPNAVYRYTWTNRGGAEHSFSWPEFEAFRDSNPAFSEVAATRDLFARVKDYPLVGELVTANYFRMLGVSAVAGRTLLPEDGASPGSAPVVVLSYKAWQNKLGGDPNIIGKAIVIRGYPLQVIGITRPEFTGLSATAHDFWIPITMASQLEDGPNLFGSDHPNRLDIVGRLRTGFTARQAEAALMVWAQHAPDEKGRDEKAVRTVLESRATLIPLTPQLVAAAVPLLAAFLLVLLIACANIANMMLARGIARQREIGVRLSLGATRMRLARQLLTESLALSVPAALVGLVFSETAIHFGQRWLFTVMPVDLAQIVTVPLLQPDIRVYGLLFGASVVSAILSGLAPAVQATRLDVSQATKGEVTAELLPIKFRNALVTGEITACVMLLICTGLSLRASARMSKQEVGFGTRGILELDINEKYRSRILSRLAEEPIIRAVAEAESIPLNGMLPKVPVVARDASTLNASYNFVSPSFFNVLDITILNGRNFTEEEARGQEAVAIVSQKTALQLWPGRDAVGQTLRITPPPGLDLKSKVRRFPVVRIIGVAADIASCCLSQGMDSSLVYLPVSSTDAGSSLLVQVDGSAERARRTLETEVAAINPDTIDQMHTLETFRAAGVFPFRVATAVCMVVGGLALLLALSGVYGVLSYSVSQRTREIGIRLAIGAAPVAVARLVLKQSMRLALIGGAAGSVLAFGVWRILSSRLFFMSTFDGVAFFVGALVPLAAAGVAAYIPARRAMRVDPMVALRYE